jgi:hypothetical protein
MPESGLVTVAGRDSDRRTGAADSEAANAFPTQAPSSMVSRCERGGDGSSARSALGRLSVWACEAPAAGSQPLARAWGAWHRAYERNRRAGWQPAVPVRV